MYNNKRNMHTRIEDIDLRSDEEVRLILAGGREFKDYALVKKALKTIQPGTKIVCGMAKGADLLGKKFGDEFGYEVKEFPADWDNGKRAGYLRNLEMGRYGNILLAFWDGESGGTESMIDIATDMGLRVIVVRYR